MRSGYCRKEAVQSDQKERGLGRCDYAETVKLAFIVFITINLLDLLP